MSNLDDDELTLIERIIVHAYIMYGVFPLQISLATLLYYLYGEEDNAEIRRGFLQFLPTNEANIIKNFNSEHDFDHAAISDVFIDLNIFSQVTKQNIDKLILKAGKTALLRNPCFAMQNLVKGMTSEIFFKKISYQHFKSLYDLTRPNAKRVINSLSFEGKIVTWVCRYIRSLTAPRLETFLRFITGVSSITPSTRIKVEFVDQSVDCLRPLSKTCFKIFIVGRQYFSFTQLHANFNLYINNPENWSVQD